MSRPVKGSRGLYVPDAEEYEELKKGLIRQKQNKYTPLVNITARNFLEKVSNNNNASRGVTFGGVPIEQMPAVVEVDENPIYLRTVQDDAMYTKPGEPFHPAYPGSTKMLNHHNNNNRMNTYGQSRGDPSLMMTMMRGGGNDGGNNNNNNVGGARASSSPAGGNRRKLVANPRDRTIMRQIDEGNFYQDAVVGTLNMIIDPFANPHNGTSNNARTHMDHQIAAERRERELRDLQLQATQKASLHRAHAIRHSCSESVEIIKILLAFRGVNVNAVEGPHNAVTNRFMQLEFLQDLQWLLKDGPTLIHYPSPGTGAAPHLRYFSIRLYRWAPSADEEPMLVPFLVWMYDASSMAAIGKAPLCNLLGVTTDPNESVVMKRFVSRDGKTLSGPPVSANKKAKIPIDWCASLWFKCLVTGNVAIDEVVQPIALEKSVNVNISTNSNNQQQPPPRTASPVNKNSRVGGLDAETAAARGLGPAPSYTTNNNSNNFNRRSPSPSSPASSNRRTMRPGTLGRINVDVAGAKYGDIIRFVKLMEGISKVNEVLVQQRGRY